LQFLDGPAFVNALDVAIRLGGKEDSFTFFKRGFVKAKILEFHPDMVGERVAFFVSDLSQDGNGSVVRSSAESAEASAVRVLCKCCSEISHKKTSLGCFFVSGGSFPLTFTDVETRKGTKGDKEKSEKWRFYAKIGDFECFSTFAENFF
jgi:hypothetical protein